MAEFALYVFGIVTGLGLALAAAGALDIGGNQAATQCAEQHNVYRCERVFVPASTGEEQ